MPKPRHSSDEPEFGAEEWIEPPPELLRRVLKSFRKQHARMRDRIERVASLAFDSWTHMAPSGVRGTMQERQVLFSEANLDIDVQTIEEDDGTFTVHGQVLARDRDVATLEGSEVQLLAEGRILRRVLLDEMGYFRFTLLPSGRYALRIVLDDCDVRIDPLDVQEFPAADVP